MRVFTCTDHPTHWPVGGASVVVAEDEADARQLLISALKDQGLRAAEGSFTLKEVVLTERQAIVLNNGEY